MLAIDTNGKGVNVDPSCQSQLNERSINIWTWPCTMTDDIGIEHRSLNRDECDRVKVTP